MGAYLARRLATLPLLILGISGVSFVLLNLAPGDPAGIALRQRNPGQAPSPIEVAAMRAELGLDAPLPVQFIRWMSGALTGDLGESYVTNEPVAGQLARRTVPTVLLTTAAFSLAMLVAVPAAGAGYRVGIVSGGGVAVGRVAVALAAAG